jgi:putative transcriptional regulator
MISIKPEKGHLLVAEPSIFGDSSFSRSVVLIAEHGEDGTVGFVLNKTAGFSIRDLIAEFNQDWPVYNGGPVEIDQLYFVHRRPDLIPDTLLISNNLYWGGDFNALVAHVNSGAIASDDIRFFLGYSGWDMNQLDEELKRNSWIVSENNFQSELLTKVTEEFWRTKMLELGGTYPLWANAPENPNLN